MGYNKGAILACVGLIIFVMGTLVIACGPSSVVDSTDEPVAVEIVSEVSASTSAHTTMVLPIQAVGLTLAAVGDWYGNDPSKGRHVKDAEQTRDAIIEAVPSLLLVLGDLSYDGKSPERFFDFLEPLESILPVYPAYGNHDGIVEGEITRPAFYQALRQHFQVSEEWYSFDVGPVHFISINSEYPEGSDGFEKQFSQHSEDLADAFANDSVRVIIPFFHRAMVNPISPDGPDRTLQEFYHPLLDRYAEKIPLALQAHHHIYVRTHAISYSDERDPQRCKDDEQGTVCEALHRVVDQGTGTNPTVYGSGGIVFVTVGTGGGWATGLTPDGPYVAVRLQPVSTVEAHPEAGTFGYLHLRLDEKLEFIDGEYRANNGQVLDSFRIKLP